MRAIKKDKNYADLLTVEVEVAFDSEVKSKLFVNEGGIIVCPEETKTIVSVSEAVNAGYKVGWKDKELIVSKRDVKFLVKVKNGTPVLPNEVCLELIKDIERAKKMQVRTVKVAEDEFQMKEI